MQLNINKSSSKVPDVLNVTAVTSVLEYANQLDDTLSVKLTHKYCDEIMLETEIDDSYTIVKLLLKDLPISDEDKKSIMLSKKKLKHEGFEALRYQVRRFLENE